LKCCILGEDDENKIPPGNIHYLLEMIDMFSFSFVPTCRHECLRESHFGIPKTVNILPSEVPENNDEKALSELQIVDFWISKSGGSIAKIATFAIR
jgi:hypothetical protein